MQFQEGVWNDETTVNSLFNYTENIMYYEILNALRGKSLTSGSETDCILSILGGVGSKLGNVVYPDKNKERSEWLYDMVWRAEKTDSQSNNTLLKDISLILESELDDVDRVMYDFQKLLLANVHSKVMIFKAGAEKLETINNLITEQVRLYPLQMGDSILCIAYNNSCDNFQYKIFKKLNDTDKKNKYILCIGKNCKNLRDKNIRESAFRHADNAVNHTVPYAVIVENEFLKLEDAVENECPIIFYVLDGPVVAEQDIINQELAKYARLKGYYLIGFDGSNLIVNNYDIKSRLCCISEGLIYLDGLNDDLDKLMMGLSSPYKE